MENAAGMKVSVSDFGAVIVDIIVPDRNKNFVDVNLYSITSSLLSVSVYVTDRSRLPGNPCSICGLKRENSTDILRYDHNYVLNRQDYARSVELEDVTEPTDEFLCLQRVAELYEEESGRVMEVFTDMPGMQFYSANHIDGMPEHRPAALPF